ncbi:MAG: hypothetical protein KDH16_23775 [Rhodocyclaceae bacterium]|nr:hypothetical protein [Rhodocyclaceae bacterium]
MAYTSTDLQRLDAAIAGGTLSIELAGRRVVYRSMDELLKARAHVAAELAAAANAGAANGATRHFAFKTLRGD